MGKKYFETKRDSLESSILGVWQDAAVEEELRHDARTKQYKEHRAKLEAARQRRESKKINEEVDLDEEITEEEAALFELSDEAFDEAMKKKSAGERKAAKKARDKYMKTAAGKKAAAKAAKRAAKVRAGTIKVDPAKSRAAKKRAKLYSGDEIEEGDKEEYTKFFNAALKKFGVESPADFKSDEEKKKFFNYIDKNYEGDHEEEVQKLHQQLFPETKLKESKKYAHGIGKVNAAFEIGTPEYRQHTQSITPGQDITDYQRFKVSSMKEALAKVWGLDEAKKEEKDLTNELKGDKTMTGKKANPVDVKPEIKDK